MEIQGATVKDFHDLKVWQKAHQLTLAVYQITAAFPREELYGLTSQLRDAVPRSQPISPRDADEMAMPNSPGFAPSPWDRRVSWSITCCWPRI
jgi:hypothetical protein